MLILKDLPTGVIVGSASIKEVVKGDSFYEWHLTDVERVKKLRKPKAIRSQLGLRRVEMMMGRTYLQRYPLNQVAASWRKKMTMKTAARMKAKAT